MMENQGICSSERKCVFRNLIFFVFLIFLCFFIIFFLHGNLILHDKYGTVLRYGSVLVYILRCRFRIQQLECASDATLGVE